MGSSLPGQGRTPGPLDWEHGGLDHPRPALGAGRPVGTVPICILGIEGRKDALAPDWASEDLHEFWREKDGRVRDELSFFMGFAHTHVFT